ncbi:PAS domain S-box protein, partial [candidate division KSB1 bacterium]|nr:PAS domain S-box protein [candidate division KSB1 bacterium]
KSCLAELGKIFRARRAAIFQFRENFTTLNGIMEWCDKGVSCLLPEFGNFDSGNFQWWVYKLQNSENIIIEDITTLPAEADQEKQFFEAAKIKSVIAFPLQVDYEMFGFVVLDMSDVKSKITDFEIQFLRFIADMISLYFYRMQIGKVVQDIEQRYRDLIELTYSAVVIHRDGKILYINQKGAELVGATNSSEIVGKSIFSFVHPADSNLLKQRFNKDSGNRIFPLVEQKHIKLDGEVLYIEVASMVMNYQGKNAYLSVVRDISHRKKVEIALKESEQRYRTLFESSPEGIILIDLSGKVLMANHTAFLIFGFKNIEEMMETSIDSLYYVVPEHKSLAIEKTREIIDTGVVNRFIINARTKQKNIITIEMHNSLIRDNEGNPTAIMGFFHDITHQKRMENELRESKERYQLLVDNQIDLVVKVDREGRFLFVSPSYCETFGKTEDELLGKHFMPLVHEDDREKTEQAMKNLYVPPYTCSVEQRAMTKNGWRWLSWIDKAILDKNNQVLEIIGLGRDIHEKKMMEFKLRASEERFRELAELLPEIVFEMDLEGNFTFVNRIAFDKTGYSPDDLEKGINVMNLVIPEEGNRAKENMEKNIKGEFVENREYTLVRKDGITFPVIARTTNIKHNGRVVGIRGIINDISDLKQAEDALRISEQRFRDIIERSIDGYYFINTKGEIVYLNAAAEKIFRFLNNEMNNKELFHYFESDSKLLESMRKKFSQIMGGKTESWDEIELQDSVNKTYWIGYNGRRVIENGIVIGIEGFVKDITKQKMSEIELRNSEARYRTLFKNIPYEVFNLNSNGHFRDANVQFLKKWGNLLKKKTFKSPNELLLYKTIQQLVDKIRVSGKAVQHEFEIKENNESIFYRLIISPIVPSENFIIGFVGLNIDITDQIEAIEKTKNFSARLVQIQEDEREHISREIHDNLGQILTALKFELTTAESALNTDIELSHKKLSDSHKTLSKAIIEARNLCSSLRPHLLDDFGLDIALKDYLKEFSQKWKFDVDMRIDTISGLLKKDEEISLYRVAQEALNNILKYAKATKVFVELYKQNDKIVLLIKDNGRGFDIQRINNSNQLHLGLIGMRERVEYLNGEFIVNSEISKGTEIKAVIPAK